MWQSPFLACICAQLHVAVWLTCRCPQRCAYSSQLLWPLTIRSCLAAAPSQLGHPVPSPWLQARQSTNGRVFLTTDLALTSSRLDQKSSALTHHTETAAMQVSRGPAWQHLTWQAWPRAFGALTCAPTQLTVHQRCSAWPQRASLPACRQAPRTGCCMHHLACRVVYYVLQPAVLLRHCTVPSADSMLGCTL